jgi:DNA-binding FrmR family transcriptional regulator
LTHTIREKQKLLARVRRVRGQVEALERSLEADVGCDQVMHLIAGIRGSIAGLMAEVMEDHVRTHFVARQDAQDDAETPERFIEIIRAYLK